MAETNAYPTEAELLQIRSDLASYLPTGKTLTNYMAYALAEVKRALEDQRGVTWPQVFNSTADAYLVGDDGIARNADRIKQAVKAFTAALLFRDYAIDSKDDGKWWAIYQEFWGMGMALVKDSRLDIDTDESGVIDESEEHQIGQAFLVK